MNREYKSDVFSLLMQKPEYALDVYNALNGTNYENEELIEILQLEKGISLTIRNDASFIIDSHLNLYEHQSTYNPNMPVRYLIYIAFLLEKMLKEQNLFGKKRVMIPLIHCVVFYNGVEKQPARQVLKLSDSYCHSVECPDLELTCVMININATFNDELLAACSVLKGYMIFVDKVRKYLKFMNHDEAIERGIDECIEEDVLKDFFTVHRQEVLKVAMLDYTFERQIELEKRDSYAEGRTEERSKGIRAMVNILTKMGVSTDQALNSICEEYHITMEEAKKYLEITE